MSDFIPTNDIEIALDNACAGRTPMPDFLRLLLESELAVPSGGEVMSDGEGFQPLLFEKNHVPMVACFTSKERIGNFTDLAPYCLTLKGKEFLRRMPAEYGLVVNPGQSVGFDITPDGLTKIISEFI